MATTTCNAALPLKMDKDGMLRVSKTRFPSDTIVAAFLEDLPAEEIAAQYPEVNSPSRYYSVVDYYLPQRLAENVRRRNVARFNASGIRKRLLARKKMEIHRCFF